MYQCGWSEAQWTSARNQNLKFKLSLMGKGGVRGGREGVGEGRGGVGGWGGVCFQYLPTFRNQKSWNFTHCSNPLPQQQTKCFLAAYSENFFINQFAEKRLIYVLNTSALKTGISTSWDSRKSGGPNFWRFWKSQIRTVPIKLGQLAGMVFLRHFGQGCAGTAEGEGLVGLYGGTEKKVF